MTFSSILGAAFFVLMGLGGAWAGVYVARANHGTPIGRRWPKAQTLLMTIGSVAMGLGWIIFGLAVLKYARGDYLDVPPTAPIIDQDIFLGGLVCLFGGLAVLIAWAFVHQLSQNRGANGEGGDS